MLEKFVYKVAHRRHRLHKKIKVMLTSTFRALVKDLRIETIDKVYVDYVAF